MHPTQSTQSFKNQPPIDSSMEAKDSNKSDLSLKQKLLRTVSSLALRFFAKDSTRDPIAVNPSSISTLSKSTGTSSFAATQVNQLIQSVKETKQDKEDLAEPNENELTSQMESKSNFSKILKESDSSPVSFNHQAQVISSHKLYTVEFQTGEGQSTKSRQDILTLPVQNGSSIIEFLNKEGARYYLQAKNKNSVQLIEFDNHFFVFTPAGKVYFSIEELGSGNFKTTSKIALLASIHFEHIKEEPSKVRAFSVTLENLPTTLQNAQSLKNEIQINIYIREQFQILKLATNSNSNISLSNVCVAKSVKNVNESQVGIMAELCDGDMETYLTSNYPSQEDLYFFMSEMAKGVGQLHSINIIHRDLKSDNFLYIKNEQGQIVKIKVADFGLSSRLEESHRYESKTFPFYFVDPQWLLKPDYEDAPQFDKQSDIYQLGISFYQILQGWNLEDLYDIFKGQVKTLQAQDQNLNAVDGLRAVKQHPEKWLRMNEIKDPEVRDMVLKMLNPNPQNRPSIQEVESFFLEKSIELKSKAKASKAKTKSTNTVPPKLLAKRGYTTESDPW